MAGEGYLSGSITKSSGVGSGGFTAIASVDTLDRDNEVLDPHWADPLPASLPVHHGHGGPLVGSGRPYTVGRELRLDAVFASTPLAQECRQLVVEGHLSKLSVIFHNPTRKMVGSISHITKAELLAADLVTIPSNREAAVLTSREYSPGQPQAATKAARRQVVDLMLELAEHDLAEVRRLDAKNFDPRSVLAEVDDALLDASISALLARVDRMTRGKR